jgi:hypothetical protein
MIESYTGASTSTSEYVRRRLRRERETERERGREREVQGPSVIIKYMKSLGTVDNAYQYTVTYGFLQKSLK